MLVSTIMIDVEVESAFSYASTAYSLNQSSSTSKSASLSA
jgi:hypothetical protein